MASFPRFKRKTKKQIAVAAGQILNTTAPQLIANPDFNSLSLIQRASFSTLEPSTIYSPMPMPGPGDWLRTRNERGQTYKSFSRRSFRHGPHGHCKTLEVIPIGTFTETEAPAMSDLKEFMEAYYYGVTVRFTKPVRISDVAKTGGLTEDDQLLCPDAMDFLRKRRKPRDVFAQIAITMTDITPGEGWNFVYGLASMSDGVGIFSFARYGNGVALLKKSCKTMAHEVGHIFGLKHCIYYHCILNGNNGNEYAPMHCCPVCLRKLHDGCDNFNIIERYKALGKFYERNEWNKELEFVQNRITGIEHRVSEMEMEKVAVAVVVDDDETNDSRKTSRPTHRLRRRMGTRVHLKSTESKQTEQVAAAVSSQRNTRIASAKVVAPRGIIIRKSAKKNSRMVKKMKCNSNLEIPLPVNTLRTPSGTVRIETSCGWTTHVNNRGIVLVNVSALN